MRRRTSWGSIDLVRDRLLRDGFVILAAVFVALRLLAVQPWVESVDAYAYWTTRSGMATLILDHGRRSACYRRLLLT